MLSFQQALELVLQHKKTFGIEQVELLNATGRILAQNVTADRGFPPYNRVTMDGVAINTIAFESGKRSFAIEEMQAAGSPQLTLSNIEHCIEVMTGAVLPANTNAVVPYEQCEIKDSTATIKCEKINAMQNVHQQGIDSNVGDLLVPSEQRITPAMVAIIASVGLSQVEVKRLPKVAVCSTGDELIDIDAQAEPHQVRQSNAYMLAAEFAAYNIQPTVQHVPDDAAQMTSATTALLTRHDVLIFSGAVSKGKFDYLPQVLQQLGMQTIFHQVAQRPGKPFLFGKFSEGKIVFGFPGNPASSFVCYHKYFKPWLDACLSYAAPTVSALLTEDVLFKPSLTLHLLVQLSNNNGVLHANPVNTSTSGDMVQLVKANGIMTLPADRGLFKAGEVFEVDVL